MLLLFEVKVRNALKKSISFERTCRQERELQELTVTSVKGYSSLGWECKKQRIAVRLLFLCWCCNCRRGCLENRCSIYGRRWRSCCLGGRKYLSLVYYFSYCFWCLLVPGTGSTCSVLFFFKMGSPSSPNN